MTIFLQVTVTTCFILAILMAGTSHAVDRTGVAQRLSPEIQRWVQGLTNQDGMGCCATADGYLPDDVEWDTKEGHYRVFIRGIWVVVPDRTVIHEPNKLGFAMVWYYMLDGNVIIRCFLRGNEG